MKPGRIVLCLIARDRFERLAECVIAAGLEPLHAEATEVALQLWASRAGEITAVIAALGRSEHDTCWPLLAQIRNTHAFGVVFSTTACEDCKLRLQCYEAGARMVSQDYAATCSALTAIAAQGQGATRGDRTYTCPKCGIDSLNEEELHTHYPLYHSSEANIDAECPICKTWCKAHRGGPDVHIHNQHGPPERREPPPARFAAFAWVVCRRETDGKFLMVNEPAGIAGGKPGYWLPAGRVDEGESLVTAALRETMEEGGIEAEVTGVLRFMRSSGTPRVIFLARAIDPTSQPKSIPDFESVGAMWVAPESLAALSRDDYRSPDPARLFPPVATGEMTAHSISTPEFQRFDEAIRNLTMGKGSYSEIDEAWKRLKDVYPATAFKES